jgi:hypothetical protein
MGDGLTLRRLFDGKLIRDKIIYPRGYATTTPIGQ